MVLLADSAEPVGQPNFHAFKANNLYSSISPYGGTALISANRSSQIFQKFGSHLKIAGDRKVV